MSRRKAREETLKILYPLEVGRNDLEEVMEQAHEFFGKSSQWTFVQDLVKAVNTRSSEIDDRIIPHAVEWPIARMSAIDRTVLRIAVAEMLYFKDIPYEVTINEAVEMAKKYGGADSGGFINGILSSIHKDLATAPLD